MKFLAVLAALMVIPSIYSENVFRLHITPEESQRYFSSENSDDQRARDEHFRRWDGIAESHVRGRDEHDRKWDGIAESHARGRDEHFRKWDGIAESHARGRDEHNRKWDRIAESDARESPNPYSNVYNGSPNERT